MPGRALRMKSFSDALLSSQPTPVMVLDEGMEIIGASLQALRIFDIRSSVADNQALASLSAALEAQTNLFTSIGAATMQLSGHGSQEVFEWKQAAHIFRITVFMFAANGDNCFGVLLEDHTEEALLQSHIGSARSYLETVLDSLPLGVIVLNTELRATSINAEQLQIFETCGHNITLIEAVGSKAEKLFPAGHTPGWPEIKSKVIGNGESVQINESVKLPDGSTRTFSIRLTPLFNDDRTICGALRTAEDITVRVELEKKLKDSEIHTAKLETVHQISLTLSDSINNALTAVVASVSLVQRIPPQLSTEQTDILNEVFGQTQRITGFIKKIREMQKVTTINYSSSIDEKMIDIS